MTTRAEILDSAFEALSLAGYVFDLSPEERASAFRKLDTMMAEWEGEGITLGYTPGNGNGAGDDVMTTPLYADDAISHNLALRIAPSFGKTPSGQTKRIARRGYDLCAAKTKTVGVLGRSRLPFQGAGDWRLYRVQEPVTFDGEVVTYPDA